MTAGGLHSLLDRIAPFRWAFPGDRVGLLIGSREQAVSRIAVSLDPSQDAIDLALSRGCDALVAHHPLIWDPLKAIGEGREAVVKAVKGGLAVWGFHTNWDCSPGGVNDTLAGLLGLEEAVPCGSSFPDSMLKVFVTVPRNHARAVMDAAAQAGAGTQGKYSGCAFWVDGRGTFQPEPGASPAIGEVGEREEVEESKIEMLLPGPLKGRVESAIRASHPYEEPVIDFIALEGWMSPGVCRVGRLPSAKTLEEAVADFSQILGISCHAWGKPKTQVQQVAVCGGAGSGEWGACWEAGADVLVTGEVKHNHALEALEAGFSLIQAGHHQTEHPGMAELARRLAEEGLEVVLCDPEPGSAARPWSRP